MNREGKEDEGEGGSQSRLEMFEGWKSLEGVQKMKGACLKTFPWGFFIRDAKALRLVANGKVKYLTLISDTLVSRQCQAIRVEISSPPFKVSMLYRTLHLEQLLSFRFCKLGEAHE